MINKSITKNQHYVPQFYLRKFAKNLGGERYSIGVYSKSRDQKWLSSPKEIAYRKRQVGHSQRMEDAMGIHEGKWGRIEDWTEGNESKYFFTAMAVRNPIFVDRIKEQMKKDGSIFSPHIISNTHVFDELFSIVNSLVSEVTYPNWSPIVSDNPSVFYYGHLDPLNNTPHLCFLPIDRSKTMILSILKVSKNKNREITNRSTTAKEYDFSKIAFTLQYKNAIDEVYYHPDEEEEFFEKAKSLEDIEPYNQALNYSFENGKLKSRFGMMNIEREIVPNS